MFPAFKIIYICMKLEKILIRSSNNCYFQEIMKYSNFSQNKKEYLIERDFATNVKVNKIEKSGSPRNNREMI